MRGWVRQLALGTWVALVLGASGAAAAVLPGDLDGDGSVGPADEQLFASLYAAEAGDGRYDPAADLDGDGRIDALDLAPLAAAFGRTDGTPDAWPPALLVTLNDVPDDQNDLLVAPPERFQVTLHFDASGGSLLDPASLRVTAARDLGPYAAGSDLTPLFGVTPARAVWEVPAGSDLARTTHAIDVEVADRAGNLATAGYAWAVRDFAAGPPLGAIQTVFLDFDQDRSGAPEVDFLEDLRHFGLSTAATPSLEAAMRDRLVGEIAARAHGYYGRLGDGSPGPDAANVVFTPVDPGGPRSRLCVGGTSSLGASYLGASTLDPNNAVKSSDECAASGAFGVFPRAISTLWSSNPEYRRVFDPLDASRGGTPVGADPVDPVVLDPAFDPDAASAEELARFEVVEDAVDAFAQAVATAVAHETGHLVGLTPPGPTPGGLFGGTSGADVDHNVTSAGTAPAANFLMNAGNTFRFEEMTGRAGFPLPVFRPLSWAYLRDRLVVNARVTGLYEAPAVTAVSPDPVSGDAVLTVHGENFLATPTVELVRDGDPTPNQLPSVVFVDGNTITATFLSLLVPPGVYDVRVVNPDDQVAVLPGGLTVQ